LECDILYQTMVVQ